jgi:hypothetical protein
MQSENRQASEPVEAVQIRQRMIGREIRRLHESTVTEPVPPHLLALLHQFDTKEEHDDDDA